MIILSLIREHDGSRTLISPPAGNRECHSPMLLPVRGLWGCAASVRLPVATQHTPCLTSCLTHVTASAVIAGCCRTTFPRSVGGSPPSRAPGW